MDSFARGTKRPRLRLAARTDFGKRRQGCECPLRGGALPRRSNPPPVTPAGRLHESAQTSERSGPLEAWRGDEYQRHRERFAAHRAAPVSNDRSSSSSNRLTSRQNRSERLMLHLAQQARPRPRPAVEQSPLGEQRARRLRSASSVSSLREPRGPRERSRRTAATIQPLPRRRPHRDPLQRSRAERRIPHLHEIRHRAPGPVLFRRGCGGSPPGVCRFAARGLAVCGLGCLADYVGR